ncbi:hypothetical protein [Alteraurantiacibacter palmitatis]|uniref:DUF308 domain-containing protein n=1 Tax=Alteraurantiacibacter palmitatis TaxID=2054628 RepID=A0ABV7E674_9SPHN
MASLADEKRVKGKTAKPPISTHPAFPFIVALWFAALLGIGSLVVPVPLIERISVATGLAAILPPAAPPLGFTARLLMALAFTAGGALVGLFIARKVAEAHRAEPALRRATRPVAETDGAPAMPRPISALDELGSEGLDGRQLTGTPPRGRRALAIEEEAGPSTFLEFPPLPGTHAGAIPASMREAVHASGLTGWRPDDARADEADDLDELDLALVEMAQEEEAGPEMALPEAPMVLASEAGLTEPGFSESTFGAKADHAETDPPLAQGTASSATPLAAARQEFRFNPNPSERPTVAIAWDEAESHSASFPPQIFSEAAAQSGADEREPEVDDEASDLIDHSQFLAPHAVFDAGEADAEDTYLPPAAVLAPQTRAAPEGEPETTSASTAAHDALDELGLVQLAQRLGSSIERRRALLAERAAQAARRDAAAPANAPAPAAMAAREPLAAIPLLDDVDAVAPDEAAQAMAAWFDRPARSQDDAARTPESDEAAPVAIEAAAGAPRQVFKPLDEDEQDDTPETGRPDPMPAPPFPTFPGRALDGFAHIDIDEEEEDEELSDLAASFALNLGAAAGAMPDDGETAPVNPFAAPRQTFVRIEDEPEAGDPGDAQPAVVFPAETPVAAGNGEGAAASLSAADQEAQDRALREALLNLQRMSGAA